MAKFSKSKVETEENKNEEVVEKVVKVEESKIEQPKVEEPKKVTKVVKPESLADFLF